MKAFIGISIILALFAMSLSAPPKCPKPPEDGGVILLPNPDDCCTFYSCNGNIPILLPCLNETWFNPEVLVCDWPENVEDGVCKPPKDGKCNTF